MIPLSLPFTDNKVGGIKMKRDFDLIREILITLENDNNPESWKVIQLEERDQKVISYHVKLLTEAGLIEGKDTNLNPGFWWYARSLTNQGHDFLDTIKNETTYSKIKEKMGNQLKTAPLTVVSSVAVEIAKEWTLSKLGF
ncbi:DUF2513 domain-containing protein [Bacillus velezensis]|uniref:DUF2513 domain-containing protein n=2 Tax=Bacillaceae TaxID=186817 RepID=A0ABC8D8X6_BACVE|nr:DUF2513 domain-containing protein [Bacillus velezensis]AWX72367.1 DUF2513 domain-containing protein [Bacillus velezensis]PHQ05315.1 DUF2513 domain-containing protein [Bacillus velezensis]